jgi:hypothetical protein
MSSEPEPYRDEATVRLLRAVKEVLESDADPAGAVRNLFARRAEFLIPLRAEHAELQASTLDQFADAFDALELAILLGRPLERFLGGPAYTDDSEEGVGDRTLADLFRSGTLVAGEVLVLMRAGYGTGALARWRALHEIATRAEFISGGGRLLLETARRYVQHEQYRQLRELETLQGWIRKIDPGQALPRDTWKEWLAEGEKLVQEYGDAFRGEYGWAHEQLIKTSSAYAAQWERGARPRGPVFEDLERVVRRKTDDPRRWQPLYEAANAAVHGAPRSSISFEHGRLIRRTGPHLGPMWEPGEATARRLSDLTWAFGLPDFGEDDEDPYVGIVDKMLYAVAQLAEMAEHAFAAPRADQD